jgi:hypothetical protein
MTIRVGEQYKEELLTPAVDLQEPNILKEFIDKVHATILCLPGAASDLEREKRKMDMAEMGGVKQRTCILYFPKGQFRTQATNITMTPANALQPRILESTLARETAG